MINTIKHKLTGNSLISRFLRGSAWLAAGTIAEKVLALASKIILARLLMPQDLGVVVLIASITGLFECMTEVGVKQCVIQNKEGHTSDFLNMAWWFSAVRGLCLFAIAWSLAPWVCHFYFEGKEQVLARYDWPTLYGMVRIASLSMVFQALISPQAHLIEKQFRFARVVAYRQSAAMTGILLTIILSFVLRNAWAMVLGFICQAFLLMVMSYVFCPFWPKLSLHRPSLVQLFRFGRGMWGSPFFAYIAYSIDILVGGKILGTELIGLYGFAVGLAYVPRDLFARIINPVLMPAFAERQDNPEKLRKNIGQLAGNLILLSLPVISICFLFHNRIITTLYGADFAPVSLVFAVFTVNVFLIMLSMIFGNLFLAMGKPQIIRNYTFFRALLLACLTLPVAKAYGMLGMAILQVLANLALIILFLIKAKKMISLDLCDIFSTRFSRRFYAIQR